MEAFRKVGRCGDEAPKVADALVAKEEMKAAEAPAVEEETKAAEAPAAEEEEMTAAEARDEAEMRSTDFIIAYKRLPRKEIELLLAMVRTPFDPSMADYGFTREEHEEAEDSFFRFQDQLRREYEATGVFKVDDDYIAKRVKADEIIRQGWSTMFDDFHDSDFDDESDFDDVEDMDQVNHSATNCRDEEEVALLSKL